MNKRGHIIRTLLASILLLCAWQTQAAEGYVSGLGTKTCAEIMDALGNKEVSQQDLINWTQGYFSGANVAYSLRSRVQINAGSAILQDRLMMLVKNKCDERPDYPLAKAVFEVHYELRQAGQ